MKSQGGFRKVKIEEPEDEREDVQKKTQTKWINSMLSKGGHPLVQDLFYDLRDGTRLLALLEVLTNKEYKREKGRMRVHHLNNVSRALQVLQEHNVRLVNISNNEIVDGNGKITLALSWSIFLHWQVNDIMKHLMATTHQSNLEKALLSWCQMNTKPYPGVDIKNFSTSWSDGLAFGALIHRWRPEIVDFAHLTSRPDASERLETVFDVAHKVLGIERLLDPEDVDTAVPDKKSVMMYVMCLFQSLAHSGLDPPPLPSTESLQQDILIEVAKHEAELHKPPSEELVNYKKRVEEVVEWLLVADERINEMEGVSEELNYLKKQFQEHEKFMLELTEHQGGVGEVLQEGSKILSDSILIPSELEEVKGAMKTLNTQWEQLRLKAMDRQNKIHEKLMTLQLAELEALKEFLTTTEDRISRMGAPCWDSIENLDDNLREQKELHEDILRQQERVVSFSNLVVVVDENNQDNNEFSNMEDQLAALSERWAHICGWTEKRGTLLTELRSQLPNFLQKEEELGEWLIHQERKLKEVEANPNDTSQDSLMERYEKLQKLQSEMESKMSEISGLEANVQNLVEKCKVGVRMDEEKDDKNEPVLLLSKLENLQDRWEALSQIMEAQSQRITKYGVVVKSIEVRTTKEIVRVGEIDMVDIVAMSNYHLSTSQQEFGGAKRSKIKNEWKNVFDEVNEWSSRTLNLISSDSGLSTFDELSGDEQLILWEDLESELHSHAPVYEETIRKAEILDKYLKQEGEESSGVEGEMGELSEKWEQIRKILNERKLLIDYFLCKKQLQNEINTMSSVLSAYEKWLEGQGEVSPISNQPRKLLEQCRVKWKTIKSHEGRIGKLRAKGTELLLLPQAESDKEMGQEFNKFSLRWDTTVKKLEERLGQLESINKMSAEEKYTESSHLIESWLGTTFNFMNESPKITDYKSMESHLAKLKELLGESKSHEQNLEVITIASVKGGTHSREELEALEELRGKHAEMQGALEEKKAHFSTLVERLEKWQAEMSGLEGWLEEVDVFVCAEKAAVGDADILDAQLEQSNALQSDIESLTKTYESLCKSGKEIQSLVDGPFLQGIRARLFKLTSHWNETVKKAEEQNVILKEAYDKTRIVLRGIDETGEWLSQLSRDAPKLGTVSTPSDLGRLCRKYNALKERVDKREAHFRLLNDHGNELLLLHSNECGEDEKRVGNVHELARSFTTLNARWTEITGMVDRNSQLLKDASFLYGEFRSLTAQEMDWLDRLEKKLKKPVTAAADIEELSEDLDDIEQYVGNEQELRLSKLQEIGRKLVSENILVGSIQSDVQQVTNRWTFLNQQAECRKSELESEMFEAEEWENCVQQLWDSLEAAHNLLSERLEHDLSPDDLLPQTQELRDELKEQEKVLGEMSAQVIVYRKSGKLEAAQRLEEQKNMLQSRFNEVESKFSKFSSPPPESKIIGRIERIWRSLRQVEQALVFLELASDDPESILGQLNHCTREYNNLSELKREVEGVLKEGRRHVEDKKAESKLASELDSIKALYNKLGMQIATIRSSLEKGLSLSSEMGEQMGSLELWLEQTTTQLATNSNNLTTEQQLQLLRSRSEELPRWSKILQNFQSNYESFFRLVDPVLLDSLKERRNLIFNKWEKLSGDIVRRHEDILKNKKLNEIEEEVEKTKNGIEEWVERAEGFLNKVTTDVSMLSDEEMMEIQRYNDELGDKSGDLEELKDCLVDLVVLKGDPFSFENPENILLQKLTHRIDTISTQFHTISSCILLDPEDDSSILSISKKSLNSMPKNHEINDEETGICNPGFNFDDDEEEELTQKTEKTQISTTTNAQNETIKLTRTEIQNFRTEFHIPLPQKSPKLHKREYSIQNEPEVSVTIKNPPKEVIESKKPKIESNFEKINKNLQNIEKDEEEDSLMETENIPSDEENNTNVIAKSHKTSTETKNNVVRNSLPNMNVKSGKNLSGDKERNIKIVEIKSNDIVQGILRMEPHLKNREKLAQLVEKRQNYGPLLGPKAVTSEIVPEEHLDSDRYGFSKLTQLGDNKEESDIGAFEREGIEISKTMSRMARKLEEIERDSDPRKRVDALEMELISVEPEVALAISRGDSLIFKISKVDIGRANQIRASLDLLRSDWLQLKSRAERQRIGALKLETTQLEIQRGIDDLNEWIILNQKLKPEIDIKKQMSSAKEKEEILKTLKKKLSFLNKRGEFKELNFQLDAIEKEIPKIQSHLLKNEKITNSDKTTQSDKIIKNDKVVEKSRIPIAKAKAIPKINSTDLVTQINKLREEVATISRSLASSEDPIVVRRQLEALSPKIQKLEEIETHSDQSRRVSSKLLDEWATLNITHEQIVASKSSLDKSPSKDDVEIDELLSWLQSIELQLKDLKVNDQNNESEKTKSLLKLKELENEISRRHRGVMLLMSKKSRMSPAYDENGKKIEAVGFRWRNLLADITIRRDRLNGSGRRVLSKWWEPHVVLREWIERGVESLEERSLISDETALRNSISSLKTLEHEVVGKKIELEKVRQKRHLVSEEELENFRLNIEKLCDKVPEKRKNVEESLNSLRKLSSHLDNITSWVLEVRAQVATAKHRPPSEKNAAIDSIMMRVGEKESEVMEVIRNYINLQKDTERRGQTMTPLMIEKIHQLKEDWLYVKSRGEINVVSPEAERKFFSPPLTHEVKVSSGVLKETTVEVDKKSVFGTQTSLEDQISDLEMTLNLKSLKQQSVVVGDPDDIRNVLEKQKNVLRELEMKKPQLDELMQTAESLKTESNRHNLHGKVSKLMEHWGETNSAVVGRKTELENCLVESLRWDGELREIEGVLNNLKSKLSHSTDTKGLYVEVERCKFEVDEFFERTQRLSSNYPQDDMTKIKTSLDSISQKFNHLTSSLGLPPNSTALNGTCSSTNNISHISKTSSSSLTRSFNSPHHHQSHLDEIERESRGIYNLEMALNSLENEIELQKANRTISPPFTRAALLKIEELQCELESHASTVASLGSSIRSGAETREDAAALLLRLDEMNHRWHGLKQRSIAIRSRLESNSEHWHALSLSLRDLIEWVGRKETELASFGPLGGDSLTIQKQLDEHRAFRRELDGRRGIVETNLISGRQHVANEPPVSDSTDPQMSSAEMGARELTRNIRREVSRLSESWGSLLAHSDNWQLTLEQTIQRMRSFQQMLDDTSARLATAEAIKSRWPSIAAAADKSSLLDQLKTFREHISSTQRAVTELNEEGNYLNASNIHLSPSNSSRLDDLNQRLKNLQLTAQEKETQLSSIGGGGGVASVIAVIPPSTNSSVEPPWERALTPTKVPYYINHENESTQWDHPRMTSLLNSLSEFNDVRFSAYRTALKLRAVQKQIKLDSVPLQSVIGTFESLGLRGHNDRLLDVPDMLSTLSTLYNTLSTHPISSSSSKHKSDPPIYNTKNNETNVELLGDLGLNWVLNVYDGQRTGQVRNLSFKVGVVLLSKGPMEDKFRYLFRLVADAEKQVDQRKLGLLLHDCMQIPKQLGEIAAFGGSNIEPSVRSCFEKAGKDKTLIEVPSFLEWVRQEPQSLVWLPVLHRIAAAESAKHQAKCNVCKQVPIIGLRYRCLKCFNFDLCQSCFFSGRRSKSHKLTHPMQEYCTESTSGEDVRDFTRALKNRFKSKRTLEKSRKLGYLPVSSLLEGDMLESPAPSPIHSLSPEMGRDGGVSRVIGGERMGLRANSTPESEDEHSLIAEYCSSLNRGDGVVGRSPAQILASLDAEESEQLEGVIRSLEEENSALVAEYERLRAKSGGEYPNSYEPPPGLNNHPTSSSAHHTDSNDNNIVHEARLLREHKGRLESRMQLLEEHNRGLETQLSRLRQLLDEPKRDGVSKTGTLQSKSVVAAELAIHAPISGSNGISHQTPPPPHNNDHWSHNNSNWADPPPPPTPGYSPPNGSFTHSDKN